MVSRRSLSKRTGKQVRTRKMLGATLTVVATVRGARFSKKCSNGLLLALLLLAVLKLLTPLCLYRERF
ncbi:unknown [Alces alces papillomavirus 1]|uniref:Uncharacterized protein n=1 Tax=European elk papillomavirus TaxID=2885846 RepID=Q84264_PAPVE|nr:hypothetical protein EEPVgp15 [Alces alces papillomavirus 1]AAA66863.1 unknown [Alces alces papillomavirus 1]